MIKIVRKNILKDLFFIWCPFFTQKVLFFLLLVFHLQFRRIELFQYNSIYNLMQVFVLTLFISLVASNILFGGDLEFYSVIFNCGSEQCWGLANSDVQNWYMIDSSPIQVKYKTNYPTSTCIDLSNSAPGTLCQDIRLTIGKKYSLSYSLFCQYRIQNMTLQTYLNGDFISSLFIENPSSFNQTKVQFFAQSSQNQVCFNETHIVLPNYQSLPYINSVGGMIDNISLTEATYVINFSFSFRQLESKIVSTTNMTCSSKIENFFRTEYRFRCQQQDLQDYRFNCDQNTKTLLIQIQANKSYYTKNLLVIPIMANPNFIPISEIIEKYFHYLNQEQKKICSNIKNIGNLAYFYLGSTLSYIRYGVSSFFILTFLSFENLPLFYIFLDIRLIPLFAKQIYFELLDISFYLEDFGNLVNKIFSLPENNNIFSVQGEEKVVSDVIDKYANGKYWFGYFEVSSLVLKNNIDNFIVLILLIAKLLLLKIVFRLVGKCFRRDLHIKTKFKLVLLVELVAMTPSIVLSSIPRVMNSVTNWAESLEKQAQILLYFLCLSTVSLHALMVKIYSKSACQKGNRLQSRNKAQHQKNKTPNNDQSFIIKFRKQRNIKLDISQKNYPKYKIDKICFNNQNRNIKFNKQTTNFKSNKIYIRQSNVKLYHDLTDIFMVIAVPTFSIFGHVELFFFCVGLVIILKFIWFNSLRKITPLAISIVQFCINFVWAIHHLTFLILYIMSLTKNQQKSLDNKVDCQIIIILGFISLVTLICGFSLQLIKFVVLLFRDLGKIYMRLKNHFQTGNRVYDESLKKRKQVLIKRIKVKLINSQDYEKKKKGIKKKFNIRNNRIMIQPERLI